MRMKRTVIGVMVGLLYNITIAESVLAERFVGSSTKYRTLRFFKASDAAVQRVLPAGWTSSPAKGALESANFGIVIFDRLAAEGPDAKPVLSQSKTATAFVLAKNEQAGAAGAVVVFAFASTPEDVPGPYSVNMLSKVDMAKSFRMGETGSVMAEETWDFSTEGGDQLHFSMTFERGAGRRSHTETRVYSAAKPDFYRIYKADLVTDLVRGATGDAGRVKKIEFRASGPHLSPVFNGTERMIGITSDPAYYRQIFLPD